MIRHLFDVLIAAIMAVIIVTGLQYYMPAIEGRFFPVAVSVDTKTRVNGEQVTEVSGIMEKRRDCAFVALKVLLVTPSGEVIANASVQRLRLRPTGSYEWGPWLVSLPIWQANAQMRAYTWHQCHPFWQTQTTFFDTSVNTIAAE